MLRFNLLWMIALAWMTMVQATVIDLTKDSWRVQLKDGTTTQLSLPGTLADYQLGEPAKEAVYGALTLKHVYIGKATYSTSFTVSPQQVGQYELFLERVLWQSEVTLDGQTIGTCDSLATPHCYSLTLTEGTHTLSVTVDNSLIHPIGEKAHSYGDAMQTRWNGILGAIELRPYNPLRNVRIDAPFGDVVTITLPDNAPELNAQTLLVIVDGMTVKMVERGKRHVKVQVLNAQPWSPTSPNLYTLLLAQPCDNRIQFSHTVRFGFRTFAREGNRLFLNGKPLFVRGNLDNCHFPLTGYPAMTKEVWLKLLKAQKDQGANQIRFHTWCPPQAAFDAADELGILLSPEAGIWIDGWMTKDFPYLKGLGKGPQSVDTFVQNELRRILDTYGNAPSFFSLSIGNELGSSDFTALNQWMAACKAYDNRHLYAASTARQITKSDDFIVTHAYPGIGMIRERLSPGTDWDYEGSYRRTAIPTIAHEIGQWPVYPNFDAEIPKYTGILRPWNLEILRDQSEAAGVMRFVPDFNRVSLKTNRLMYKAEIESFLRTPSCAGISLLGIQDYSGQGEALIGWLDSFYDVKPGAEEMAPTATYFADTVPLARFAKDTWTTSETLTVKLLVHHYGQTPYQQTLTWSFGERSGSVDCNVPSGSVTEVATLQLPLADLAAPARHTLTFGENRWSIWVYPAEQSPSPENPVCITDDFDEALTLLKEGARVVFDASQAGNPAAILPSSFKPVYWSTTWFPGQRACALGLLIQNTSEAFKAFPTEDWQDWQWYHLVNSAKTFRLKGLSKNYVPLVMPVIDFHKPTFAGMLFDVAYGEGKLIVSGIDLSSKRPEAQQLRTSLIEYAGADTFNPQEIVSEAWLKATLMPPKRELTPRPKVFEKAVAYIECAAFRAPEARDEPWRKRNDRAELTTGSYEISGDNLRTWADNKGKYWVANAFTITFKNITNVRGKLLVRFRDPDSGGARKAVGDFDGARNFVVPEHGVTAENPEGSYWLELPVDMEDFLDGELRLNIRKTSGANVMLDRVILMPNAD